MNPFEVFNEKELKQVGNAVGRIENRDYTKEEWKILEHSVLKDIMSNSKNEIQNVRIQYNGILDKLESCISK